MQHEQDRKRKALPVPSVLGGWIVVPVLLVALREVRRAPFDLNRTVRPVASPASLTNSRWPSMPTSTIGISRQIVPVPAATAETAFTTSRFCVRLAGALGNFMCTCSLCSLTTETRDQSEASNCCYSVRRTCSARPSLLRANWAYRRPFPPSSISSRQLLLESAKSWG